MKSMDKETWLEKAIGTDTVNELATKSGIASATAWRQYNNDLGFTAENVILIARAYKKNPIEALIVFGYLRNEDLKDASYIKSLEDASDEQLLSEMARRIKTQSTGTVVGDESKWSQPITIDVDAAAKHDPDKRLSKGRDEEFAD
jgi:hypothetical protein